MEGQHEEGPMIAEEESWARAQPQGAPSGGEFAS